MSEQQIEEAERLLSYYEAHGPVHNWGGDVAALLRDLLPEWSAFKTDPHDDDGNRVTPDWVEVGQTTP